jgi:hypothetical protein
MAPSDADANDLAPSERRGFAGLACVQDLAAENEVALARDARVALPRCRVQLWRAPAHANVGARSCESFATRGKLRRLLDGCDLASREELDRL